jgi:hypothetical protein
MEPPKRRKKGKGAGTRIGQGPNHNKYATGTDACMRLEESNVATIVHNDPGEDQDKQDDEGAADERDIWEVAQVTEEDFETTEGLAQDQVI